MNNFITKTTPYEFQIKALELGCFKEYFAYFMDMGTGKSKVTLDTAATLFHNKHINFMLLTCPKFVIGNWINDQIPTHLSCDYTVIRYVSAKYRSKSYKQELLSFKHSKNKLKIVLCNFAAFLNDDNVNEFYNMLRIYNSLWVIDESSKIKNIGAISTKTIISLAPTANYRRILTGTPMTIGLQDLWSQYMFLNPSIIGCNTFTKFKNRYTIQERVPSAWLSGRFKHSIIMRIVGYQNQDELLKLINPHTFRIKLEEGVIPMPVFIKKEVELTSEQKKLYEEIKNKIQIEITSETSDEATTINLESTIAKISKLQQVLCGFIYDENHNVIRVKSNRAKICADLINESSSSVIIFYWFRPDFDLITEELTKQGITFTSDPDEFTLHKDKYKVFVGQMASKSMGSNLQHAKITIYYSNCFFAEYRWQSERRNYRLGQDSSVVYIDLITPNTIEEKIINNLTDKTNKAKFIDDIGYDKRHQATELLQEIIEKYILI